MAGNQAVAERVTALESAITSLGALEFRDVSTKQRAKLAGQGKTLSSKGNYPTETAGDLDNAIEAYGRAKEGDRAKLKSYLARRADQLGVGDDVKERISNLGSGD